MLSNNWVSTRARTYKGGDVCFPLNKSFARAKRLVKTRSFIHLSSRVHLSCKKASKYKDVIFNSLQLSRNTNGTFAHDRYKTIEKFLLRCFPHRNNKTEEHFRTTASLTELTIAPRQSEKFDLSGADNSFHKFVGYIAYFLNFENQEELDPVLLAVVLFQIN